MRFAKYFGMKGVEIGLSMCHKNLLKKSKQSNRKKDNPRSMRILTHWLTPIRELSFYPSQVIFN